MRTHDQGEARMTKDIRSYMLIFRETTPERYSAMSAEERREALNNWNGWCDRLAEEGKLKDGHPLMPGGRIVGAGASTKPTDGPFTEAKELIGGYFIVEAVSLAEAVEIAEQSPNIEFGMSVEVREVAGACHLARSLGMTTMREPAVM